MEVGTSQMTKKKTTSTATLGRRDPYVDEQSTTDENTKPSVKEWWVRASASFFVGFLSLWITYELPSSLLSVCLGTVGVVLFVIVPAFCIIIATVKENDWA